MFPFLSLEHVSLEPEIVQRLPRRLAYYHLALPIAEDADGITVAMAHPENPRVIEILEGALQVRVIPVQSFAETIREQLDRVWQVSHAAAVLRVALWGQSADAMNAASAYVDALVASLGRQAAVERVLAERYEPPHPAELIIALANGDTLASAPGLFHVQSSLLILRPDAPLPQTVLHALRGHIPDFRVLDWLTPLARRSAANVTLLMSVDGGDTGRKPFVSDLSSILMGRDKRQEHIDKCRRTLAETGVKGRLRLRQRSLLAAIDDELAEMHYDLVAIAAEAYGDFAQQVGAIVWPKTSALLVIKP